MLLPPAVARVLQDDPLPLLWTTKPSPGSAPTVRLRPLKPPPRPDEEVNLVIRKAMRPKPRLKQGSPRLSPGSSGPSTPGLTPSPKSASPFGNDGGMGMFWREPGRAHGLIFLDSPAQQLSSQDGQKRPKLGEVGSSVYGAGWRQQMPRPEPASTAAPRAYGAGAAPGDTHGELGRIRGAPGVAGGAQHGGAAEGGTHGSNGSEGSDGTRALPQ
mmetsp:Transcript_35091/g.56220  ORF Transcript_35091/g.56220 Transcript_35091/m.56220 type:complete len:214 (-) Transcript_35091:1466-2107(-)